MSGNRDQNIHFNLNNRAPKLCGMMIPEIADLKKQTLPETYESLGRKFKGESGENYDNLMDLINNKKVLNADEQSMRLIIIDSLQSKEGIIKALLSDDLFQIKRALKCKWFFENTLTPSFYEAEILPKVAFSTRCKIINKLGKYIRQPEHAEQLFGFIRQNYGSKYAEILLPKCRPSFISSYIEEYKPLFQHNGSVTILIKVTQKYPDIVLPLLEGMCHKDHPFKNNLNKFSKVFLCLAEHHPSKFIPFFEKHYLSLLFLRFGNKLTRNLSTPLHKVILASAGELHRGLLNDVSLFNALDFQGKVDFMASIIKSKKKDLCFDNWYWALPNFLPFIKYRPASERVELLETVFKQVYEKDLWAHPKLWRIQVLELLPLDVRERCVEILSSDEKYASIELQEYCSSESEKERSTAEKLIYLQKCEVSIPKLQEIVKKTPCAEKRKVLIVEMGKSCSINKNLEYLQKVCEYIASYHRNDEGNLIKSFLFLVNTNFNCKKFDLKLWSVLEEIATISVLSASNAFDAYQPIIEKYILFRLENNLCPREEVKNMVKFAMVNYTYLHYFVHNIQSPFSEKYFHLFYEELFRFIDEGSLKEEKVNMFCFSTVYTINYYNEKHKKNLIQTKNLKTLLRYLDKVAKDSKWDYHYNMIMQDPYFKQRYATDILQTSFEADLLKYLLKRNPDYIKNSLTNILNDLFTEHNKYFKAFFIHNRKIFDFLNLSEEIRKITKEKFQSTDSFVRKLNALKIYSCFAEITEFEKMVQEYEPKSHRIDYKNNASEFVKIQLTVPELIQNMKPDSKNFAFIFKFMNGDFLKPVLTSFNSACYNSPIGIVVSILREKLNAPVSVKKCILRNISEVSSLCDKLEFCVGLWEKEKHYSIRTVILKTISRCFLEEPTDDLFSAVKKCILESDEPTFEARPDIRTMPARYINEYASIVWQISEKLSSNINSQNAIRNSLTESFNIKNIWILSEEFCERVIRSGIFVDNSKLQLGKFTSYYLISNPHSMKEKLLRLLNLMLERKQNEKSIVSFLHSLEAVSLEHPKYFYDIFDAIIKFWNKNFSKFDLCDEFIRLQVYWAYHKILPSEDSKDKLSNSINFANELKEIIEATPDCKELYYIFYYVINTFFENIAHYKCPLDSVLMIRQLITPPKRELAVIGILLLPDESFKIDEISETGDIPITLDRKKNIGYIVNTLKNYKDHVAQMYFNRNQIGLSKFKNVEFQN